MFKIPLFKPDYSVKERNALLKAFDEGWLAMGKYTKKFESDFSGYLGGDIESLAVSNCTAALHMAILAAGIGKGDEVIVPALTFVADINAVKMTGAKPVVADSVSLDDWNMSPDDLQKKITPKTKAVIAVHYAGFPFDKRIGEICRERKILLIEDCAHAVGASLNGAMCGTWGDMAAFSFYANKNLAVGEGGMFVSRGKWIETVKLLRSHGMTALSLERNLSKLISYDVRMPGLNYRLPELNSVIGIEQLRKLDAGNKKRKALFKIYYAHLNKSGVQIPFMKLAQGVIPAYHIFPVLLPEGIDRRTFMEEMRNRGVQTSIHYPSFRDFTGYKNQIKEKTPVADLISARTVTLPLYPGMSTKDVEYVSACVKFCLAQ